MINSHVGGVIHDVTAQHPLSGNRANALHEVCVERARPSEPAMALSGAVAAHV